MRDAYPPTGDVSLGAWKWNWKICSHFIQLFLYVCSWFIFRRRFPVETFGHENAKKPGKSKKKFGKLSQTETHWFAEYWYTVHYEKGISQHMYILFQDARKRYVMNHFQGHELIEFRNEAEMRRDHVGKVYGFLSKFFKYLRTFYSFSAIAFHIYSMEQIMLFSMHLFSIKEQDIQLLQNTSSTRNSTHSLKYREQLIVGIRWVLKLF